MCNGCEYYEEVKISYLDSSGLETDLGIRIVQCRKKKQELLEKQLLYKTKNQGKTTVSTCVITIIKEFETNFDIIKEIELTDKEKINAPNWCPK